MGRKGTPSLTEAESVRLAGTMVGILADNDDFHFVKQAQIEGVEYKSAVVNSGSLVFASYKLSESDKVIFFKFGCQMLFQLSRTITTLYALFTESPYR